MIYLYNDPSDYVGMFLDYFKVYFRYDQEEVTHLLSKYKYISTSKP